MAKQRLFTRGNNESSYLYEKLIIYYQRWYTDPRPILDTKIQKLVRERGLTWDEAVRELYNQVYVKPYKEAMTSISIYEALSLGLNRLKNSPILVLPVLVGEAISSIYTIVYFILLIILVWALALEGASMGDILGVASNLLLHEKAVQYLHMVLPIYLLLNTCLILFVSLGRAWQTSIFYPMIRDSLRGSGVRLENALEEASNKRVNTFLATLIENSLVFGPSMFLPALAVILYEDLSPLVLLSGSLILIPYIVLSKTFLQFIVPSVVISERNPLGALKESLVLAGRFFGKAFILVIFQGLAYIFLWLVTSFFILLNVLVANLISLVILLLIQPVFDSALAALYMDWNNMSKGYVFKPEVVSDKYLLSILKRGLNELKGAINDSRIFVAPLCLFLGGLLAGFLLTRWEIGLLVYQVIYECSTCIPHVQFIPVTLFLDIFFHNWSVAAISCVSGYITPIIPASIALFNGVMIGILGGVREPIVFLAGIVPHGIVELTGFIIALGVGSRLYSRDLGFREKAEELKKALLVAIGLIPLFLVAAFIETFVTPQVLKIISGTI